MMKKYSGVFCLLLGTALLLSLCGCGFTGANRSSAKAGNTEMQAAPSGTAAQPMQASPTPEPAPTPTPIPELTFPDGNVHMADEETLNLSWLRHADAELTASLLRQMPNGGLSRLFKFLKTYLSCCHYFIEESRQIGFGVLSYCV